MEAREGNTFITHHVWILSKIWLGVHAEELGMGHTESHFEILPLPTCKQKFNQNQQKSVFKLFGTQKTCTTLGSSTYCYFIYFKYIHMYYIFLLVYVVRRVCI